MRDVLVIVAYLIGACSFVLLVLAVCDWAEQRKWMTTAERQRIRRESREWGSR